MADRIYYVICADDCRAESMTKEQIFAAIAEATGNTPTSVDDAFITKIKEINASETVQIWKGTEAQFNALSPAPTVNKSAVRVGTNGILYICTDDTTIGSVAAHAETHKTGGSDEIKPSDIGASAAVLRFTLAGGTASITVADNTEYRFSSAVTSLALAFPYGNFDCWMRFTAGDSITVTLPSTATYIGGAPTFEASKTYEMSIKDGVVICAEVTSE